jgi:hypothetical protein
MSNDPKGNPKNTDTPTSDAEAIRERRDTLVETFKEAEALPAPRAFPGVCLSIRFEPPFVETVPDSGSDPTLPYPPESEDDP